MRFFDSSYANPFSLARARNAVERGASLGITLLIIFCLRPSPASGNVLESEPSEAWVPTVAFSEGHRFLNERKWAEAVIAFRSVLNVEPGSGPATLGLARALVFSGRREEAVATLIRAGERERSERRRAFVSRADVLSRIFLTNETFQIFQEGANMLASGKFRFARERLARALEREPDNVEILVRSGQALVLDRDYDSAAERLRLARRLNPFEPVIRAWLGRAMHQRGEIREAVSELRAAAGMMPDSELAAVWLAEAMISAGQRPGALRLLEEHARKFPDHVFALVQLGRYRLLYSGTDEQALWAAKKDLQVALSRVEQTPQSADAAEHGFELSSTLWQPNLKSEILKLMEKVDGRIEEQKDQTEQRRKE